MDIVRKKWNEDTPGLLSAFGELLHKIADYRAEKIKLQAEEFVLEKGTGLGQLMNPLRLCLVGGSFGPDLSLICELLGKDEVITRISNALNTISKEMF
jgi:glutamyl-tRNA synthetase